jgi:glutaminyl-tRNA synthetase
VVKDASGKVMEVLCEWDPNSKGGNAADGRKVKGTIHWISASECLDATVHLYDRLFTHENPLEDKDNWLSHLNPKSKETLHCKVEPSLGMQKAGEVFQFERLGYFTIDQDSKLEGPKKTLVLSRTITLKDTSGKT